MTILDLMNGPHLGRYFRGASWDAWRAFLAALFGLVMTPEQLAIYQRQTGRIEPPTVPAREAWCCCGRRAGKSIIAALVSFYLSVFVDYAPFLGPGEMPTAMTVSPDRKQSRVIQRFQRGFTRAIPQVAALVVAETADLIEFANGTILETTTASDAIRGYTSHCVINDEVCFLPPESSADPDVEVLNAERPCLASLPGSLLLSISSPHARRGVMWSAYQQHYGKARDPVLFWKAASLEMNPSGSVDILRNG